MKLHCFTVSVSCVLLLLDGNFVDASYLRQKAVSEQELGTWGHTTHSAQLHKRSTTRWEGPAEASSNPEEGNPVKGIVDTAHKVMKTDIPGKVEQEYYTIKAVFLPGLKFMIYSFLATITALLVSIIWFTVYFGCVYQNDYEEIDGGRWTKQMEKLEQVADAHNRDLMIRPDIMIVFHHPEFVYADQESKAPSASFERVVVSAHSPNTPRDPEHAYLSQTSALHSSATETEGRQSSQFSPRYWFGNSQDDARGSKATFHQTRVALLQDLYKDLYDMGFGLKVFSSIDEDEIFLGVQLRKAEAIRHYLYLQQYSLRVRRQIIQKLGVGQPPDVVPPMLRFDKRTIEGLYQSKVIDNPDASDVFKTYSGGLLVSTRDRVRLIYGALADLVDLDAAKHAGFIVDWYPVHNPDWIPKLKATWASYSLLWDTSFVQPVLSLQSYFGVRVAFIFAWNGLYCKALFALLPLALLSESIGFVLQHFYDTANVVRVMVLSFNIIIVVWSRLVYNMWEREDAYFMQTWNMNRDGGDYIMRPSFHGEWRPTLHDSNKLEKHYPESKLALRRLFSFIVTIAFCGLVAAFIVVWYDIFKGRLTPVAVLSLMLQIKLFEFAWNAITPMLTEFENHKYQFSFYDSYLWKNFIFQAVNSYSAYFYIAIKLQNSESGCPDGSCLNMLRRLLISVQIILSLGNVSWLLLQAYWVRFVLWHEEYTYRKANDGADPPERPPSESEAKMSEFRNREQIESMCGLMLSIGFILLFGAVAPVMVPFSLLVFSLNLRVNAVMLVNYMKRPIPRKQVGIGAWKDVILILMKGGVFFSGFLLVVYGDTFRGVPLITRLVGLIIYCLAMFAVWAIVDYVVPGESKEAHTLKLQHQAVLDRIHSKCQEKEYIEEQKEETLRIERKKSYFESPIARRAWAEIRPLAMTHKSKDKKDKIQSMPSSSSSLGFSASPGSQDRGKSSKSLSGDLGIGSSSSS